MSGERGPVDRITLDSVEALERFGPQSLDEIVVSNCTIHLERMTDHWYFLGIRDDDGLSLQIRIGTGPRGGGTTATVYGCHGAEGIEIAPEVLGIVAQRNA